MWIMLNDSFFSIVKKDCADDELRVYARRPNDIQQTFGEIQVQENPDNDYRYSAIVKKTLVNKALNERINTIDYGDFEESIQGNDLQRAYSGVWRDMEGIQVGGAFACHQKRSRLLGNSSYRLKKSS